MLELSTPSAHLDPSVLADLRALGDPGEDVLADLARLYLSDAADQLAALAAAIDAGQAEAVWQIAHRLKGSSLAIGAWRMAATCGVVEVAARGGALDRAAVHAEEVGAEFQVTRLALEHEVRG